MSVSREASHVFDVLQAVCLPESKHIFDPHPTHSVVLPGGVFCCTACGATAVN